MKQTRCWAVDYCVTGRRRVARTRWQCARCGDSIPPGDAYLEVTELPGGQSGHADAAGHPVRLQVCAECVFRRGDSHMVDPLTDEQFSRDPARWDIAYAAGLGSAVAR